jgi:hypothetical protein
MNNLFNQLGASLPKIQKQHIQILVIIIVLAMLVLGAGAPYGPGPIN